VPTFVHNYRIKGYKVNTVYIMVITTTLNPINSTKEIIFYNCMIIHCIAEMRILCEKIL